MTSPFSSSSTSSLSALVGTNPNQLDDNTDPQRPSSSSSSSPRLGSSLQQQQHLQAMPTESPVATATRLGRGLLRKISLLSLSSQNESATEPLLGASSLTSSVTATSPNLSGSTTALNAGNNGMAGMPVRLSVEDVRLAGLPTLSSSSTMRSDPSWTPLPPGTSTAASSLNGSPTVTIPISGSMNDLLRSNYNYQRLGTQTNPSPMRPSPSPGCAVCSPHQHQSVLMSPGGRRIHPSALVTMMPNFEPLSPPSMTSPPPSALMTTTSSLASKSTRRQQIIFIVMALLAIVFRLLALFTVTTETSMWVTMTVRHKHIDLAKQSFQKGYFMDMLSDLYHAGAYSSFAMMLIGVMFVPLIRITCVMLCFFLPVRTGAGEERRTKTLFVLDHVGRFILIDIFAIGYGAVFSYHDIGLLQHLLPPDGKGGRLPPSIVEDIRMTVSTQLHPTFYCGIISNVLGTLLTHHMLLMSIPKHPLSEKDIDGRTTLFGRFSIDKRAGLKWYQTSTALIVAVIAAMGFFIHLAVFRAPIISFKPTGFTGQIDPTNHPVLFDIWTLVHKMPETIYYDQDTKGFAYLGAYVLAFVYLLVILSIPVSLMIAAFALLVVPMHKQFQYQLLFSSPFWFSWCSIDVFCFFTVSEYFEMDSMSRYMTEIMYPEFCSAVESRFKIPCSGVETKFYEGMYSLLGLCFALIFIRARFLWLYEQMSEHQTEERLPAIF